MAESNPESSLLNRVGFLIVAGVVSLVFGVATALILDYIKTSAMRLQYDIISSSSFTGQTQKVALTAIEISNAGRKELENVTGKIQARNAELMETKTEGFPAEDVTERKTKDSYTIDIPFLNPSETGRVILLYNLLSDDFATPSVQLRAKGVNGVLRRKAGDNIPYTTLVSLGIAYTTLFSFLITRLIRHRRKAFATSHSDDQRDVFAFVLDTCDLAEEGHRLRQLPRKTTYWSIADDLTSAALEKNDHQMSSKLAKAFKAIQSYGAISETTILLINFDMARLYSRIGDTENARLALEVARKGNNKIIEKRLALAPDLHPIAKPNLTRDKRERP